VAEDGESSIHNGLKSMCTSCKCRHVKTLVVGGERKWTGTWTQSKAYKGHGVSKSYGCIIIRFDDHYLQFMAFMACNEQESHIIGRCRAAVKLAVYLELFMSYHARIP
jgi:hypothetical protein